MISKNKLMQTTATIALVATLSACGMTAEKRFQAFNTSFKAGDFCSASDVVMDEKDTCNFNLKDEETRKKIKKADLDSKLNSSAALFLADKSEISNTMLDQSREKIQKNLNSSGVGRAIVEVLANASAMDYNPMIMDSVYMNNYTILNALNLKDKDEAKRQIQIARKNQSDAVAAFSKEIFKAESLANAKEAPKDSPMSKIFDQIKVKFKDYLGDITKQATSLEKTVETELNKVTPSNVKFNSYANFANPYISYLSGLFELTNGKSASEHEDAAFDLKRTNTMVANNKYVQEDLNLATKIANGEISNIDPSVWVIFENGQVSKFQELRTDFSFTTYPKITLMPLNISRNGVDDEDAISSSTKASVIAVGAAANTAVVNSGKSTFSSFLDKGPKGKFVSLSFALPYTRKEAYKDITLKIGNNTAKTELLADMDAIFYAEYKKKLPSMITKAMTKVFVNILTQSLLEDNGQMTAASMAAAAYGAATAGADLRSWYALPKNVQIAKLAKNGASQISLKIGEKAYNVEVPSSGNTLLYVRVPTTKSKPVIKAIEL